MLNVSPWHPLAAPPLPMSRALASAVRSALPPAEWVDGPQWEHGRHTFDPHDAGATALVGVAAPMSHRGGDAGAAAAGFSAQPELQALSWRFVGAYTHAGRRVGHWRFQGHAALRGKRIDFYGEYLRDDTTHALREFKLSAPGAQ